MDSDGLRGYLLRLGLYLGVVLSASAAGSLFTWTTDEWANASPLVEGSKVALFSLGPALAIVSFAPLPARAAVGLALCCSLAMVIMWWQFASTDSSTSALVFLVGWWGGVPLSIAIVWLTRRARRGPQSRRLPPRDRPPPSEHQPAHKAGGKPTA